MRAFVLSLVVVHAATAFAVDRSIGAVKLLLTRSSSGREKLSFTSKDVNFMFPAIGGADDPSLAGVTIDLVSPQEPPVSLTVPPGVGNPGWKVVDRERDTYSYKNSGAPQGSVVRALSFREGRGIKLVTKATGLALAAAQGSVGIRITTGGSRRCALFDAPTILQDAPNRFIAKGAIPTGGDCSDAALGAVIDPCGNGTIDPGEQCDGTTFPPSAPPSGVQCGAPGSSTECQICAQTSCVWFFVEYACCNPAATCVHSDQFHGDCQTTSTSSTTSTSTTLFPGCGNGAVGPGEQCDGNGAACGFGSGNYAGCFPPGDPNECKCCGNLECYVGAIGPEFPCCPGLTCVPYFPPLPGEGYGRGGCVTDCIPAGGECGAGGLPCCVPATCTLIAPGFPASCQNPF